MSKLWSKFNLKRIAIAFASILGGVVAAHFVASYLLPMVVLSTFTESIYGWLAENDQSTLIMFYSLFVSKGPDWIIAITAGVLFGLIFRRRMVFPAVSFCFGLLVVPEIEILAFYDSNPWEMVWTISGVGGIATMILWDLTSIPIVFVGGSLAMRFTTAGTEKHKFRFSILKLGVVTGLIGIALVSILQFPMLGFPTVMMASLTYFAYFSWRSTDGRPS